MIYMYYTLGEKIRGLRLRDKRSLKDESLLLKVSMNSLYRWEHDLVVPRKPMLMRICEYHDVTMEWLESETTKMPSMIDEEENKLLGLYKKLPSPVKYKVLGYVERVCVEEAKFDYNKPSQRSPHM
ncbi:MAG: helix-turn-helix domain-containing protein [Oscillospiraceae bacterium]|nr:helix-turn-helix domain-containing protein [Oscillospiraceae bacterium]